MSKLKIAIGSGESLLWLARQMAGEVEWLALDPQMAKALHDIDLKAAPLRNFAGSDLHDKALVLAAEALIKSAGRALPDGPSAAVMSWLQHNLSGFLYERLNMLAILVLALDAAEPDAILISDDIQPMTRLMALWAAARQVPCFHLPHAIYLPTPERGQAPSASDKNEMHLSDIHDFVVADHVFCAGSYQRKWFEQRYQATGRRAALYETGLPQFSRWLRVRATLPRQRARHLLKQPEERPIVVYASSWPQRTNLLGCHNGVQTSYLAFLQAARRAGKEWSVVVKVHPSNGNPQWHLERAKKAGVAATVTAAHLDVVLAAGDLMLAYGPSNILLDGSYWPHLSLSAIEADEMLPGREDGRLTLRSDPDAIFDAVNHFLLERGDCNQHLQRSYLEACDRDTLARIAAIIEEEC